MALEWLKQEMRALLPQGQRWLSAMRHELTRVQALHRRERARERVLQSELAMARAALASWQARRDVAANLPRAELADAANAEVQRRAAEVEALQVVLARQTELTATLTEKLTAMETRFLTASEQVARPRRPELLIAHSLAELSQREQRFAHCEQQLLGHAARTQALISVPGIEPTFQSAPEPVSIWPSSGLVPASASDSTTASTAESTPVATADTEQPSMPTAATGALIPAPAVEAPPAGVETPTVTVDADFVTAASSVDKPERAP